MNELLEKAVAPVRAIAEPKAEPGKDLIKCGTSRFDDTLVRNPLIDEGLDDQAGVQDLTPHASAIGCSTGIRPFTT